MKDRIREALSKVKGAFVEVRFEQKESSRVAFRGKVLESITATIDGGGFVRALVPNKGWGIVTFNNIEELDKRIEQAISCSRIVIPDEPIKLSDVEPAIADIPAVLKHDFRGVPLSEKKKLIEGYNDKVLPCPPVPEDGQLLPKEEWLVNTVKAELAVGRKVVVYVRQTGTRDIRSHIVEVLTRAGVNGVAVLNPNIPPRKRERWLQENHVNVLVTNPRLVETGLDLIQYATVVFYEVEYSLYTLWQSCRRVWRLGQIRPVKVYYLAYEDTLEEKAYALIGQKIKAAQLLYGEEVASALVEDVGDASLVMALVKAIEEGEDLRLDHNAHIFVDTAQVVTESVTGSPVFRSASVFEEWLAARGLTYDQVKPKRRRPRVVAPPGQITLPGLGLVATA